MTVKIVVTRTSPEALAALSRTTEAPLRLEDPIEIVEAILRTAQRKGVDMEKGIALETAEAVYTLLADCIGTYASGEEGACAMIARLMFSHTHFAMHFEMHGRTPLLTKIACYTPTSS